MMMNRHDWIRSEIHRVNELIMRDDITPSYRRKLFHTVEILIEWAIETETEEDEENHKKYEEGIKRIGVVELEEFKARMLNYYKK